MTEEGGEAGTYVPQGDGRTTRRKPGDSACMILLKFIVIVGFVVFLVATSKACLVGKFFSSVHQNYHCRRAFQKDSFT